MIRTAQGASVVGEAQAGEVFMVKGTVRPFIKAEIERDYGLGLDPELVVEYEGRRVIVAELITHGE